VIECGEVIDKIGVVPWKLSGNGERPKEVYDYIERTVFKDVNLFLSYIVPAVRRSLRSFE